ncbi:MAG: glycosyltransferase family A protein [Alphaproteobacteria bacterium]|nr:glycosyltransferase family A protein [Alphaproteobacteria bacterium]
MNRAYPPLPTVTSATEARPFWSVIITSYKRADLLKHCLDKVINQNIAPDRMEILIADDDPQSEFGARVAEWSQGRALYTRNPHNIGTFPSMNAAISRSRGEWVHIVADDDWVGPDFYAVMENAIAAAPQEIGVAVSHHVNYREEKNSFEPAIPLA